MTGEGPEFEPPSATLTAEQVAKIEVKAREPFGFCEKCGYTGKVDRDGFHADCAYLAAVTVSIDPAEALALCAAWRENGELRELVAALVAIGRPGREQYLPGTAGDIAFGRDIDAWLAARAALESGGVK